MLLVLICFLVAIDYPKIKLVQNNIEKEPLPFADNCFDVIFSKSVVEHIYNPDIFFKEAIRVLKPGLLLTLTPDWEVKQRNFMMIGRIKLLLLKLLWRDFIYYLDLSLLKYLTLNNCLYSGKICFY